MRGWASGPRMRARRHARRLTNRPEFHVADIAASHLGVGAISVHPTSTADEAAQVIREARQGPRHREGIPRPGPRVRQVRDDRTANDRVPRQRRRNDTSWQELIECEEEEFDLGAAAAAVTSDDLLTLMYTLGTDGPPTLVRLTHADVIARVTALRERLALADGWRAISWQPMAGIAERLCTHYLPLVHGWQVITCANPDAVASLLPEIRPEFFWAPPALWERLRESVVARFDGNPERAAADRAAVLAGIGLDQLQSAIVAAAPVPAGVDRLLARARCAARRGPRVGGAHRDWRREYRRETSQCIARSPPGRCRHRGVEPRNDHPGIRDRCREALGTDYFLLRSELSQRETEYLDRTRRFVDDEVLPVMPGYWGSGPSCHSRSLGDWVS